MEKDEAIQLLKDIKVQIRKGGDKEVLHVNADDILCKLLASIGYKDVADAFEEASEDFWYA